MNETWKEELKEIWEGGFEGFKGLLEYIFAPFILIGIILAWILGLLAFFWGIKIFLHWLLN